MLSFPFTPPKAYSGIVMFDQIVINSLLDCFQFLFWRINGPRPVLAILGNILGFVMFKYHNLTFLQVHRQHAACGLDALAARCMGLTTHYLDNTFQLLV